MWKCGDFLENLIKGEIRRIAEVYASAIPKKCWLDIKEFEYNPKITAKRSVMINSVFNLAFFEFGEMAEFDAFEGYFFENRKQIVNDVKCNVDIVQVREFDKNGTFTRLYKIQVEYLLEG